MDAETARRVATQVEEMIGPLRLAEGWMPFDRVLAMLLAEIGIDPLAALWAAMIKPKTRLELIDDEPTGLFSSPAVARIDPTCAAEDEASMGMCTIGAGIQWFQHGVIETDALPETIVAAMVGRPLREVISHPVLDMDNLVVEGACNVSNKTVITIEHTPRAVSIADLIRIAPHGCR